jgi:hypothetical protein
MSMEARAFNALEVAMIVRTSDGTYFCNFERVMCLLERLLVHNFVGEGAKEQLNCMVITIPDSATNGGLMEQFCKNECGFMYGFSNVQN